MVEGGLDEVVDGGTGERQEKRRGSTGGSAVEGTLSVFLTGFVFSRVQ